MGSTKTSSRRRKTVKNRLRGGRKSRSNKKSLKRGGGPAWETVDLIRYKKVRDFTGQFRDGILTKSRYFIRYKDDKDYNIIILRKSAPCIAKSSSWLVPGTPRVGQWLPYASSSETSARSNSPRLEKNLCVSQPSQACFLSRMSYIMSLRICHKP